METNYLTTLSQELTNSQKQQIQNNIKLRVTDTSTDVAADDTTNHVTLDGITVYCKHINSSLIGIVYGEVYISSSTAVNAIISYNTIAMNATFENASYNQILNYTDHKINNLTINGYDYNSNTFDGIASIDVFTGTDMYHIWIKLVNSRQIGPTLPGTYTITITKD